MIGDIGTAFINLVGACMVPAFFVLVVWALIKFIAQKGDVK